VIKINNYCSLITIQRYSSIKKTKLGGIEMEQITLHVQGMSCGHCVNAIESNVGKLNGVESVKVHLEKNTVDVSFNPEVVSLKDITSEIEEQGYDVEQQ